MDLLNSGKVVLHPLGGAFSAKPNEARDSSVMRIPGKKLVIQGKNSLGWHGGGGAGKGSKSGDEFTNLEGHFLWICGHAGVQDGCRCLLPGFLAGSAVANKHITDGAATGDVVGVILILNVLEAGKAGGRIGELKLGVLKRLRCNRGGQSECGRKCQHGDPAHRASSEDGEQALAM